MTKLLTVCLLATLTLSCATVVMEDLYDRPGRGGFIETRLSEFDGRKSIKMEPGYIAEWNSFLRLGLRWHSDLPDNKYILLAELKGAINFKPAADLLFNVDGKIVTASPVDKTRYGVTNQKWVDLSGPFSSPMNTGNVTTKQYWISEELINSITSANKVAIKVYLLNSYWESVIEPKEKFKEDYAKYPYIWAKGGFKRFMKEKEKLMISSAENYHHLDKPHQDIPQQ